jgi:hypothetical protein
VVVQYGAALIETTLNILCRGGNTLEKILEQQHVESLRENSARDAGSRIGDKIRVNDKDAEEAGGPFWSYAGFKKLL